MSVYRCTATVWQYPGMAAWYFAPLSSEVSAQIRVEREGRPRIGWGSVPVVITIGTTTWKSSIFPDKKSNTYLLPLKAEIRKKEGITTGDAVELTLET